MFKSAYTVIALLIALTSAKPSSKTMVSCPEGVMPVTEFFTEKYLGTWYTTYSSYNTYLNPGDNCIRASYLPFNDTTVYAKNVGYTEDGLYQQVCGYAYQVDAENEPGHLIVKFAGPPGDYFVLDTDYETFAAVYSCRKRGDEISLTQGVITRTNTPDLETIEKGLDAFRRNGLDAETIVPIPHENCVYDKPDVAPCDFE